MCVQVFALNYPQAFFIKPIAGGQRCVMMGMPQHKYCALKSPLDVDAAHPLNNEATPTTSTAIVRTFSSKTWKFLLKLQLPAYRVL